MVGKLPALRFSGNLIRRSVSSDNTREYALERKPAEDACYPELDFYVRPSACACFSRPIHGPLLRREVGSGRSFNTPSTWPRMTSTSFCTITGIPGLETVDAVHFFSCIAGSLHFCKFVRERGLPLVITSSLWVDEETKQLYPIEEIRSQLALADVVVTIPARNRWRF